MSKTWVRRLMAGTVKPETSPRARASYSAWMLADRAPSSWLASQTSHCALLVVASSSLNAAVQARSRMPAARKVASSSMISRSPSRWAAPDSVASKSAGEVATWGIGIVSPVGSTAGLDDHQEDDDDDHRPEEHPAALDLLDGVEDLWRRWAGWRAGRRRRRGQLDEVTEGIALDGQRVGEGDQVQDDAGDQPWLALRADPQRPDQQDARDALEDGQRFDEPVADRFGLSRAEVTVLGFLAGHRPHDREGECRPERQDRAHDVQEQEQRPELSQIHSLPRAVTGQT